MGTEIVTRTLAPCTMAAVRDTLPSAADEGVLWDRLLSGLAAAGATPVGTPLALTVYHDACRLGRNADLEVLLEVTGPFEDTEAVRCRQVPTTLVASSWQERGEPQLHTVFDALGRWIARNGYRFAGPMFSVHRPEPGTVPQAGRDIVEVCAPVSLLQL
ncbi:MAG: hypothetical protein J0I87_08765 [Cellulomonas sp.]|nr:hypothetical protein [Cellulomonas sp.]